MKAGIAGAIVLAAAGGLYRATRGVSPYGKYVFDDEAKAALRAIASVLLQGTAPASSAAAMEQQIGRVQLAVEGLPLHVQQEVQDLFGLLTLGPARRLLAGIRGDWAHARQADVAAFLQDWRFHRLGLLQGAYHALHDLVIGPWYADEASWAAIGYPGPLKDLS